MRGQGVECIKLGHHLRSQIFWPSLFSFYSTERKVEKNSVERRLELQILSL